MKFADRSDFGGPVNRTETEMCELSRVGNKQP
jgi:hypothetical protein